MRQKKKKNVLAQFVKVGSASRSACWKAFNPFFRILTRFDRGYCLLRLHPLGLPLQRLKRFVAIRVVASPIPQSQPGPDKPLAKRGCFGLERHC